MTREELVEALMIEIKGLSSKIEESNDVEKAIDHAQRETGWELPQTADFKVEWLLNRAKRHLFFMLWTESAHKFKFESINLQHRFLHYKQLIEFMDQEFKEVMESHIADFAGVDAIHTFGTKIEAGFMYNIYGEDVTYDDWLNLQHLRPSEND